MHNDRIIQLGEDIRNHVFETLDAEPELTGQDAGKVASAVETAFVQTLQTLVVFQIDEVEPIEPNDSPCEGTYLRFE
jgi:hypothetical protein